MTYLHGLFECLGVISGNNMLNCTIYALISTIMLGFTCFDSVCIFPLCEPSYVNSMKILKPCGSQKIAKDAQRHQIWSNCG